MPELLKLLQDRLIESPTDIWPEAPIKDAEMFTYIKVDMDLREKTVSVGTQAQDVHGESLYKYEMPTESESLSTVVAAEVV